MLALLMVGALTDAPFQARLLTRDEIAETPVTELSVPQLELERSRVEEPRVVWPSYLLLGLGIVTSAAGTVTGGLAISIWTQNPGFVGVIIAAVMTIVAACTGVPGLAMGITGGVLMPVLRQRRDRYELRHTEVVNQLVAIRRGRAAAPIPESPQAAAELIRLADERPGFALPLAVGGVGGGLAAGGGAVLGQLLDRPRVSSGDLGAAIAVTCVGILLAGIGIYRAAWVALERNETDRQIAELKALPPPPAVNDYWHF